MVEVRATVDSMIRFPDAPHEVLGKLREACVLVNPKWGMLKAAGKQVEHMNVPTHFRFSTEFPCLSLPRGAISLVKKKCKAMKVDLSFEDNRVEGDDIDIPHPVPHDLREFQDESNRNLLYFTQGTAIAGCGGGKTTIAMDAIWRVKKVTVVLVHTDDLLEQWVDELLEKLGVKAGVIKGSKFKPGDVTVAMVKTVANKIEDPKMKEFLATVGFCIMDEAHHAPALTFMSVLDKIPAKYRLGVTATPKRADGLSKAIFWGFGDELINVPTAELLEMGFLMRPELEAVSTSFKFTPQSSDIYEKSHETHRALARDDRRLHEICSVMEFHAKAGETCLILANNVEYCKAMGMEMHRRGVNAAVCTGQLSKRIRRDVLRSFRNGKTKFLIATSLADEGLNVPSLSRIGLAWPESNESKTDQRTGRLMRLYDKKPVLIDFVDVGCELLFKRYLKRASVYRKLGIKTPKPGDLRQCDLIAH